MPRDHYDAIIIGAGQAAVPLGPELANAGRRTLTIERKYAGGTCINDGCTPTKTMVASGRIAYLARRAAEYGINIGSVSVDMRKVRLRMRKMVRSFRGSTERRITRAAGSELLYGEARFTGPKAVEVRPKDGGPARQLTADLIFINTGARPALPPLPGVERVPVLNSTTVMELEEVPEHLVVLGGGYIGLEFAQIFRRLGSEVTVVQRSGQVLGREDDDVAEARERGLKYRVAKMPMDYVSRAWEMGETRGLMKAIVDADSGEILGAAVLGVEGGELMAVLEVAMLGKLPYTVLREAIFSHPTLSEGFNTLFTQFQDSRA